ncbi:hypothetical protein BX661DRAFT_193936 [Kickxella alabastrina]|uniref:uncharacterized protein n=1 Tax=Kickxella alabastrina TaxID=61397 RepID=UPI0022210465|nr:uncharacterized protein BX661DRAFT_193936 [Kickxella alabastrina]KAI7827293.1 hypothetical protein BX661DRAFT_193936 [Kickxella alabastrina]
MTLYWLLSVPAHGDGHVAWRDIKSRIGSSDLYDFSLPTFKIGTLDGLVRLSDDLAKFDSAYETTLTKFTDTLRSLNPTVTASQLQAQLTVDGGKSVDQYLRTFAWDNAKYRVDRPLVEILGQVAEQMGQVDGQLKSKLTQYNAIKGSLATVRRKQNGNLSHCVRDSEYLQTLFVAVPRSLASEWLNTYERLATMVVPRSATPVAEDSEYILYSVVVFKRAADEFTTRARDARFTVRDFVYDEEALERERRMQMEVVEQETELLGNLSEWIKRQLADFYAYLETSTRASDRARKTGKAGKGSLPASAAAAAAAAAADGAFDMHEFSSILSSEYTPFVFFEIPWTFFGQE